LPTDLDDMLRKADGAMYQVKRSGKNSIRYELFAVSPEAPFPGEESQT